MPSQGRKETAYLEPEFSSLCTNPRQPSAFKQGMSLEKGGGEAGDKGVTVIVVPNRVMFLIIWCPAGGTD